MRSYRLSKTSAMFITFMLSAAVHELVMVVVTQKIRFVWSLFSCRLCISLTMQPQDVSVHGAGKEPDHIPSANTLTDDSKPLSPT